MFESEAGVWVEQEGEANVSKMSQVQWGAMTWSPKEGNIMGSGDVVVMLGIT